MTRPGGGRGIRAWETLAVLFAIAVLSTIVARPKTETQIITAGTSGEPLDTESLGTGTGTESAIDAQSGSTSTTTSPGAGRAAAGARCRAGVNGGATDTGVTGSSIKLGATVVETGIGSAFLKEVRHGMIAVMNEVNAAGGVCGRRLDLVLKDDGWDATRGKLFIENLVEQEGVFALAVVPSSEGLRAAGEFVRRKGVPVVGTDGMLISQYTNPFIWPVASATITAMHVTVRNAHDRGRRNFAIVYDSNFRFGVEGAYAFNQAVHRVTGADVPGYANPLTGSARCTGRFCGVQAGLQSYGTQIETFNSACRQAPQCDYIVYLLEPQTAQQWMRDGGITAGTFLGESRTPVEVGGPQPLFNRSFGSNCGKSCHNMWVWTGFTPPVERFASDPAVAKYVSDLRQTQASADANNSFVQGGYLGMKLLVAALEATGPTLTRERLVDTLDSTRLETGMSRPLVWSRGHHFANQCMMAFSIQASPAFAGWRQETDWVCDPWPGEDVPESEQ